MFVRLLYIFWVVCLSFFLPTTLWAEESVTLYENSEFQITLPPTWQVSPASQELDAQKLLAMATPPKGHQALLQLTIARPVPINDREALETHLRDSSAALADMVNITVIQHRILSENPLIGMLDIERNDAAIENYTGLAPRPIRQVSFLIPTESNLYQLFFYFPYSDDAPAFFDTFQQELPAHIQLKTPPPAGSNIRLAIIIGLAIALAGIIAIQIRSSMRRKRRIAKEKAELEQSLTDDQA